jgi:hypothetical protein
MAERINSYKELRVYQNAFFPSLRWEGIEGRVMRPTFPHFTLT